ncbi:MAG: protein-export chaperone SecB [Methyloligellaceae bacterium]
MATSEKGHEGSNGVASMSEEQEEQVVFQPLAQYVKDLSFENPNAPESLTKQGVNPKFEMNFQLDARLAGDDTYEVVLQVNLDAKHENDYIYKLELAYAGLFLIKGLPEDILKKVLLVECPALIFPFLRQKITTQIQDGGYPPFQMDLINFAQLYEENQAHQAEAKEDKTVN